MFGGGFGGLPRKPGQPGGPQEAPKPDLGVVKGPDPAKQGRPSTLGVVTRVHPVSQNQAAPRTLGVVNQHDHPKASPQIQRANMVAMNLKSSGRMLLSILIPTLTTRAHVLGHLIRKLEQQISALGPTPEVEVVMFEDNKEHKVGEKRTRLIQEAQGEFVVFVDDDDDISDDYVYLIMRAIQDHPTADCIGMRGVITTNGEDPHQVIYSLANKSLYEKFGIYYRPPCHLTPIRRSIAIRYPFRNQNFGEDSDFAMRMLQDQVLKNECFIDKVLYHYQFSPADSETQNKFKAKAEKGVFSIVILSARPDNLRRCVGSILENEPTLPRERIVVVDDGAGEECRSEFKDITWVSGKKPFCFSRNANLGIEKCPGDIILLNDDARLITKYGFTSQSFATRARADIGLCSAAITGFVGNQNQKPGIVAAGMRIETGTLAFISVYIPRETLFALGNLDERFSGYGYEDNDYCLRSKKAGLKLAIYDGCIVEHGATNETSTFRSKPDISALMERNRQLYREKWPLDA